MRDKVLLSEEDGCDLIWEGHCPGYVSMNHNNHKITGQGRWSIDREVWVEFTATGEKYVMPYSVGATEQQDEVPFEYEPPVLYPAKVVQTVDWVCE